jgi:hypothetical protein
MAAFRGAGDGSRFPRLNAIRALSGVEPVEESIRRRAVADAERVVEALRAP